MQRIMREEAYQYVLDAGTPPKIRVKPAESFAVETHDGYVGHFTRADQVPNPASIPNFGFHPPKLVPLAGPVYVEGATRGDLLAVHIEAIAPEDRGSFARFGGTPPIVDPATWQVLAQPKTFVVEHQPGPSGTMRDGTALVQGQYRFEMRPFVGTVSCAPDLIPVSSFLGQGPWGGNFDCRQVREGATIFLNAYHEGGLLFVGDVHGMQADGEVFGVADETRAEVTLHCEVIKRNPIPFPRVETPESIIQLYSFRPLDRAVEKAVAGLMEWLVADYGFTQEEAYVHLSLCHDFRINVYQFTEFFDLQFTVGAELPKKYLRTPA